MGNEDFSNRRPIPARKTGPAIAFARFLAESGITPNQISLFGLASGVGSGVALFLTPHLPALERPLLIVCAILVVLRGLSNMFDGMVAVEHGKGSPVGLLYNELPDRLSDVALMVGAGYGVTGDPLGGWAAASMALFVTYVRAAGTMAGAPPDFRGPMAKQERMFSLAACAVYVSVTPLSWHPDFGSFGLIGLMLWIIVIGGALTSVLRLRRAAAYLMAKGN
jgi:phosphatidylglycerophosphate synthase